MQEEVRSVFLLLFLGIHALLDLKKQQISLVLTGIAFFLGIIWQIWNGEAAISTMVCSLAPGIFLLLLALLSREAVGYGDGFLMLSVGIWMGMKKACLLFLAALLLCAVFCGILLAAGRIRKKDSVPFIPFLLVGFFLNQIIAL